MYRVVEVYQIHSDDGETYMTYADRDTAHTICDGINRVLERRLQATDEPAGEQPEQYERSGDWPHDLA